MVEKCGDRRETVVSAAAGFSACLLSGCLFRGPFIVTRYLRAPLEPVKSQVVPAMKELLIGYGTADLSQKAVRKGRESLGQLLVLH